MTHSVFYPTKTTVENGPKDFADHKSDIFFAAVETTRMPMLITDPRQHDNPIVFANKAFLQMTGYTPEELIGTNCRFLQGPDTDPATVTEVRSAIAEEREFAIEILNYRKDGSSFWNALFISPVNDENGKVVYFFASQLDVSRRRDAEDALRQAQKMEALGQLTGGIAHDFNNVLHVIQGYLELLTLGVERPEIDRDAMIRGIRNARAASDRATNLTAQLLSFARKQRLEGRPLNLNTIVETMREMANRTLGQSVAIEARLASDLANCRIDPTQVEVALLNILINARDAMAETVDKRLIVETQNLTLVEGSPESFESVPPGHYVSVSITDSGTGMTPEVLARVMDPFFTTKEEGKGTGLGLSMVYGFTKQSGGMVKIYSEVGQGTTVRLVFPAISDEARPMIKPAKRAAQRGTETVLVVEDRQDVADLARVILESLGYIVVSAANGRDALRLIESSQHVDLLFSDLIMPGGMNGVTLAREARRKRPDLKVLLTTGYAEASLERYDISGAEFDVINKPYGQSELSRKVRFLFDGSTGVS